MAIKSNAAKARLLPVEMEYKLPSAGIPYLTKHPDFPEIIKIRPYNIETEAYLLGNSTTIDKMQFILSKVASWPAGFDLNELLVSDQFTVLAIARAQTYGEDYMFRTQCPQCGAQDLETIKVPEQLPVRVWDRADPPVLDVLLPRVKDKITLKFYTIANDRETTKFIRDLKQVGGSGDANLGYIRRLAYHIKEVNGGAPDSIAEAEQYLLQLDGSDLVVFRDAIDKLSCGIQYEWFITCNKCGFLYERDMPIASDFFRRNQTGGRPNTAAATKAAPRDPSQDGVSAGDAK